MPSADHHASPSVAPEATIGMSALVVLPHALQPLQYDGDSAAKLLVGPDTFRHPRRFRQQWVFVSWQFSHCVSTRAIERAKVLGLERATKITDQSTQGDTLARLYREETGLTFVQ